MRFACLGLGALAALASCAPYPAGPYGASYPYAAPAPAVDGYYGAGYAAPYAAPYYAPAPVESTIVLEGGRRYGDDWRRDRRPEYGRPDYGRPEYGRPGFARPEGGRPEGGRPEGVREFARPQIAPQPQRPVAVARPSAPPPGRGPEGHSGNSAPSLIDLGGSNR